MSWKSKPSWDPVEGEASVEASAEFVRSCRAMADALTATVLNAEAGLNWLRVQPPDLEQVRRSLNDIANDGMRAGEIIVRLRASMKRSPTADDTADPRTDTSEVAGAILPFGPD